MCTRPLNIHNPSLDFDILNDKKFIEVPCGHCHQCITQKIYSWRNRLYYEWVNTNKNNGSSFMVTLTYNDHNLPTYDDKPCFSRRDIQLFLKRLRKQLDKYHVKFRYFITCEYGHLHDRSHYHGAFFTTKKVDPSLFFQLIQSCWQKGFISIGKNQFDKREIQSIAALGYVAKYICKETYKKVESSYTKEIYNQYFKPFLLVSKGFGECLLSNLQWFDILNGTCKVPTQNGWKFFPLSLYYIRKLYYNVEYNSNNNPVYRINDIGIERNMNILSKRIDNFVNRFYPALSDSSYLSSLYSLAGNPYTLNLSMFSLARYRNRYEYPFNNELTELLRGLAIYKFVYQGRTVINPETVSTLEDESFVTNDDFLSNYVSFYYNCFLRSFPSQLDTTRLYDNLEFFQYANECLIELQKLDNLLNYDSYTKSCLRWNTVQKFRFNTNEFKECREKTILSFSEYLNSQNLYDT